MFGKKKDDSNSTNSTVTGAANTPDTEDQTPQMKANQRRDVSQMIRLVAAFYLIYLGYKLIKGVVTGEYEGNSGVWFIIAGIFFIVCALAIGFFAFRAMMRQRRIEMDDYMRIKEEEEKSAQQVLDNSDNDDSEDLESAENDIDASDDDSDASGEGDAKD